MNMFMRIIPIKKVKTVNKIGPKIGFAASKSCNSILINLNSHPTYLVTQVHLEQSQDGDANVS